MSRNYAIFYTQNYDLIYFKCIVSRQRYMTDMMLLNEGTHRLTMIRETFQSCGPRRPICVSRHGAVCQAQSARSGRTCIVCVFCPLAADPVRRQVSVRSDPADRGQDPHHSPGDLRRRRRGAVGRGGRPGGALHQTGTVVHARKIWLEQTGTGGAGAQDMVRSDRHGRYTGRQRIGHAQ